MSLSDFTIIIEQPPEIEIKFEAAQGLPGPQGIPGEGATTTLAAGESIGGHRGVIATGINTAKLADANNPQHFGKVIGISENAASTRGLVTVRRSGPLVEPGWNWTPEVDIWLDANGLLTQIPPASASFIQRMGFALSPTEMWVDVSEPVSLEGN